MCSNIYIDYKSKYLYIYLSIIKISIYLSIYYKSKKGKSIVVDSLGTSFMSFLLSYLFFYLSKPCIMCSNIYIYYISKYLYIYLVSEYLSIHLLLLSAYIFIDRLLTQPLSSLLIIYLTFLIFFNDIFRL